MLKRFLYFIIFCCSLALPVSGFAQEIELRGQFSDQSLKVGQPVMYTFTVRYPRHLNVLLPDSTFNFAPFEIVDKTYYPTVSDSLYSTDSVIYTLATFELDSVQLLRMPAYVIQGGDSSVVFSSPDTVFVEEMISVLTDSATFVEHIAYTDVEYEFNYPYAIAGTLAGLLILVMLGFVFGKPLQRRYRIYKLRKGYRKYEKAYQEALAAYEAKNEHVQPEGLLNIWKSYMEQLESIPYTRLTTKEIAALQRHEQQLSDVLRIIDRGIYGRLSDNRFSASFRELQKVARESFESKVKEVQHA
ncbi:hypothetical protein [Nafulsella turpanensis]|uniref:hypothetical protein n=1 Tax=Nafulsella turpanensis TaxID=1265690 RepID=UPI000348D81C|nr:hypothetical protein [Nafulsella turpanensis]